MDFIKGCQALVYKILCLLHQRERPVFSKLLYVLSSVKHHLDHLKDLCHGAPLPKANEQPWMLRWVLHELDQNLEQCKKIVDRRDPDERNICHFVQLFAVEDHKLRNLVSASSWKACREMQIGRGSLYSDSCILCTWDDLRVPGCRSRCDLITNFIRTTIEANRRIPAEQESVSTAIEFLYNPDNIEYAYKRHNGALNSSITRRINALVQHVDIAADRSYPDRSNIQWLRLMTCLRILAGLKSLDEYKNFLDSPMSKFDRHLQEKGITLLSFVTEIEMELFGIVHKYSESNQEKSRKSREDNPMSLSFTRTAARQLVEEFQWTMPMEEKDGGHIPIYTGHSYLSKRPISLGFHIPADSPTSHTIAVKPITDTLLSLHSGSDLLFKELNRNEIVMCLGNRHQSPALEIGHRDSPSLAVIKFATIYPDLLLFEQAITNHQVLVHCPIVRLETTRRNLGLHDVQSSYEGTIQLWLWLELSGSRHHTHVMPAHSGMDSRGSSSVEPKAPLLVFVGKCQKSCDPVMMSISLENNAMLEPDRTGHSHVTIMNEKCKLKRREYRKVVQNIALLGLRGRNSNLGKERSIKWVQISFERSNAGDKELFRKRCNEALILYKGDLEKHREKTRGQSVFN